MFGCIIINSALSKLVKVGESCVAYVATQCAAVTTQRLFSRAPPHESFLDRKLDLMMAAWNAEIEIFKIQIDVIKSA